MPGIALPDLIAEAYEAACDVDGLQGWIGRLAEYFGDVETALIIWPFKDPNELMVIAHGSSAEALRGQFEHRHKSDRLFGKIATLSAGETCMVDDAFAGAPPPRMKNRPTQSFMH